MKATGNRAAVSAEATAGKPQDVAGPSQPTHTKAHADTEEVDFRLNISFAAAILIADSWK